MKTHRIEEIPSGFDYYTTSVLDDYDFNEIPNNVEELWYWYATAPYEGAGHMLMQTDDGLWHHHDCGHCSCYGPTERISTKAGQSLADLLARCSGDLLKELKPLTDAISLANSVLNEPSAHQKP